MKLRDAEHGKAYLRTWGMPEEPDATVTDCWCGCNKEVPVQDAVWVRVTWAQPDRQSKEWLQVPVPVRPECVKDLT